MVSSRGGFKDLRRRTYLSLRYLLVPVFEDGDGNGDGEDVVRRSEVRSCASFFRRFVAGLDG